MNGETVGWAGLAASLVFVGVAIGVAAKARLALTRPILVAVVRSMAQMLVVGAALVPIVKPETPLWWSWFWTVGIVFFAGLTVARRAPAIPRLGGLTIGANVLVAAMGLSIIFGFEVFDLDGRTIVPVAGMVIGNAMKAQVVAATRVVEVTAEHRGEIEAGLVLGLSVREASARVVRSALLSAIRPQIEQTAALGVVFLPGAMTGLVLAGVDPVDAVRAQLALMYVILAGVVVGAVTVAVGSLRLLTTEAQTVRPVART